MTSVHASHIRVHCAPSTPRRPTVSALRQHPWVTNFGAEPMPSQGDLEVEITDDDIARAVRSMTTTFTVVKARHPLLSYDR